MMGHGGTLRRGKSTPSPKGDSIQTLVAVRHGGEWPFAAFQNTQVRPMGRKCRGDIRLVPLRLALESVSPEEMSAGQRGLERWRHVSARLNPDSRAAGHVGRHDIGGDS